MDGVSRRFPRKSFVAVGALPADRIGLSARRSSQLTLIGAWARVAGSRLAARATPDGVRGGVLELRLTEDDETWTRTLLDCVPTLAAAIATAHPRLGIRTVRLVAPDGSGAGPELPLATAGEATLDRDLASSRSRRKQEAEVQPPCLERIMSAYLERSDSSSGKG